MNYFVACCDGTWNTAEQRRNGVPTPTNVRLVYNALNASDGQVARYFPGLGTRGSRYNRLMEGAIGRHIQIAAISVYEWLSESFAEGAEVVLFGFSRGAYTARIVAGMIGTYGLIRFSEDLSRIERTQVVSTLYLSYLQRTPVGKLLRSVDFHRGTGPDGDIPIAFIGLWDTVGALGLPSGPNALAGFGSRYSFQDIRLSRNVRHARHALALDEMRSPFASTLWSEDIDRSQTLKQVWFPGAHGDVGGGYSERGLSNGALLWMVEEASTVVDIEWREGAFNDVVESPTDVLHDSCTGIYRQLSPTPRSVPVVSDSSQVVHQSAVLRQKRPPLTAAPYRETRVLRVGESHSVEVAAEVPWNETGLFLEAGVYRAEAHGRWFSKKKEIDCGGSSASGLSNSLRGIVNRCLRFVGRLSDNLDAGRMGLRREVDAHWMEIVCWLPPRNDASGGIQRPQTFRPTGGVEVRVTAPGYLYAFANDSWRGYRQNIGYVRLYVDRIA
jgi:hypothetical protein